MSPEAVVHAFYSSFARRDGEAMARLYADHVEFSDPVFPNLKGNQAGNMWRMLCGRSRDLAVSYVVRSVHENKVEVDWTATYTFLSTGRPVINKIKATLWVEDGKIVRHQDCFSFWRWATQALGLVGLLLGWTLTLRAKVQAQAAKTLAAYKPN